jgi:hypothetical protein
MTAIETGVAPALAPARFRRLSRHRAAGTYRLLSKLRALGRPCVVETTGIGRF